MGSPAFSNQLGKFTETGTMGGGMSPGANIQGATTVAGLPVAALYPGLRAFANDANSVVFASVAAGGGVNFVPVYSDGVTWRIG